MYLQDKKIKNKIFKTKSSHENFGCEIKSNVFIVYLLKLWPWEIPFDKQSLVSALHSFCEYNCTNSMALLNSCCKLKQVLDERKKVYATCLYIIRCLIHLTWKCKASTNRLLLKPKNKNSNLGLIGKQISIGKMMLYIIYLS